MSDTLSLQNIRSSLIRQEDTIIFSLIERAQFARNQPVYVSTDAIEVPGERHALMRGPHAPCSPSAHFCTDEAHVCGFLPDLWMQLILFWAGIRSGRSEWVVFHAHAIMLCSHHMGSRV